VDDNAYKVNLPGEYGVSATFNVADLSLYLEDDHLPNLRTNSPQQGEDDGGPSKDSAHVLQSGPRRSSSGSKVKDMVTTLLGQLIVLSG